MVDEITPDEVKAKLDEDGVQVVDIRPPAEFEAGHIPGAINIPMSELPSRVDEVEWGDDVIVACPIGQSSVQAARLIGSFEGVGEDDEVRSMAGGYQDWEYELETGDE
ncbi:rhodanese-like domain-containing protein [Halorubrum sp. SD683]|uniref:rhodanese-like domain-containing protein n=1 Tax=Halorubrum sp. SD683 TaxID=1855873 RepID=UPI000A2E22F9|nr:rhodanese-like domain-containing protein [Halorubrum sp. SD683]OTF01702.1 sulfurtransferase [Halorubrum sp. SD683]